MTWERVHRRNRVVRDIADRAAGRRSALTDDDLRAVDAEFSGIDDFLLQLHDLWVRAFDARLDGVLECAPSDRHAAVAELCDGLARDLPGARRILDEYADEPGLARAVARHDRRLLDATGVDRRDVAVVAPYSAHAVPACVVRRGLHAVRASLSPAR